MIRFTKLCTRHLPSLQHSLRHASTHCDVIIVGGGMIGNTAAVALGLEEHLEDKNILILDQATHRPVYTPDAGYNLRVINLTVGNQKFLNQCGVWDSVKQMRYHTYSDIAMWEGSSSSAISFTADPMGFIVENNVIDCALHDMIDRLDNVSVRNGAGVSKIVLPGENPQDRVRVELESGEEYECDLLIGADGANSLVRKTLNCPTMAWNHNMDGIVCTLKSSDLTKDFIAYQRFLPTGPIALLPLGGEYFSLVWSCKKYLANELSALSDTEFVERVNNAFHKDPHNSTLTDIVESISSFTGLQESPRETPFVTSVDGARAKFPLGFMQSSRYIGPRTVLLGDASHRVLPLAGQGANIGFREVQILAIELRRKYAGDVGDHEILANFETKAQREATPMLAFIEGIDKLYSSNFAPVVAARNLGITLVNNCGPLKDGFMDIGRS